MAEVRYKRRTMTDVGKLDASPEINETPFGDIYNLKRTYSIAMKLRRMTRLPSALCLLLASISAVGADCAKFEPTVTRLVGRLTTREYPGPPNYESVTAGDKPEREWILVLRAPLCVDGDSDSELNRTSVAAIGEVQLVAASSASNLAHLTGKDVEVSGTLFTAHTGHHKTPVLLTVQEVRPDTSLERSRGR